MAYGDDMKMNKAASAVPSASKGSGGAGHDPMVKRIEKHSVKDGWWKQKKAKGDC